MPHDGHWPPSDPAEVQLHHGAAQLAIALRGGGPRRLVVGDWDVLDGYPAGTVPQGRRGGVLLPWPNRLRNGRWAWAGEELQLPVSSPESPNAMHGFVSWERWTVLAATDSTASVGSIIEARPGYPFRLAAAIDYALAPDRLDVTVRVRNLGSVPAPFGAGMHPYLHVGAHEDGGIGGADLTVPARTAMDVDDGLPTGGTHRFHGDLGRIGSRAFDDPVTDLVRDDDGWARVHLRGPLGELVLAVDSAWPWLQIYTGDQFPEGQWRRSLAVEPMTCPPNALADGADLVVLEPGAEWSGSWTLSWTAR
ncbi:MAG: aldose 1-epimerase [Blastococcus sp.]|jgi:aldose 1-epimerase|nr:aldose 1-epimerase [Blastococcus sp.]